MGVIRVIGIGNDLRGDDAAGLLVARRLSDDPLCGASITELGDDLTPLLDLFEGADAVLVVDAVRSGRKAGSILRIDLFAERLPSDISVSSHSLGLVRVIELARTLGAFPARLVLFGVEGKQFELGSPTSTPVLKAIGEVSKLIRAEVAAMESSLAHA